MDLEFVYNKSNSGNVLSEIILKKMWNEKWNIEGIPPVMELKKIPLKDLSSKLKEQFSESFKKYDEEKIKDYIIELLDQFEKNWGNVKLKEVDVTTSSNPVVTLEEEKPFPIIPPFVTQIGSGAFDGWSCIEELVIPAHINKIESEAFTKCKNLKRVYVSKNTKKSGAFSDDTEIILY